MSRPSLQTIYGILGPLRLKQFSTIQKCGASLQDIRRAKVIADGLDDTAAVYDSPRDVLADYRLMTGDKVRILHRWEYNVGNFARAEARKTASTNGVTRQQILLAIDGLALIIDMAAILPAQRAYQAHQAVLRDKTRS